MNFFEGQAQFFNGTDFSQASSNAMKCSVASAAIHLIAQSVSTLEFKFYDQAGDDIEDHEINQLFSRPSPSQSLNSFLYELMLHKLIAGDAFIRAISVDENGLPTEFMLLHPQKTTTVAGKFNLPKQFEFRVNGRQKVVFPVDQQTGASEVLRLFYPNPQNPFKGLSPVARAAMDIQVHTEGLKSNQKLLQNGMRPSGMLTYTENLSHDGQQNLKNEIEGKFMGADNAGRPFITGGGAQWTPFSQTPRELEFVNSRAVTARDIASVFNVPPQLLGDTSSSTYANQAEAKLNFFENNIIPEAKYFVQEMNHWLLSEYGIEMRVDEDQISAIQPLRDAKWERAINAMQSGILSKNEAREMLGFEPVEEPEIEEVEEEIEAETIPDQSEEEIAENNKSFEIETIVNAVTDSVVERLSEKDSLEVLKKEEAPVEEKEELALEETSTEFGHFHTINPDQKAGVTSTDAGHNHTYTKGDKYTSVVNGHRHLVSDVEGDV